MDISTGTRIKIDIKCCKGCGLCVSVCPQKNLKMSEGTNRSGHLYAVIADKDKCTGCGLCYLMCPDVAIEIEK